MSGSGRCADSRVELAESAVVHAYAACFGFSAARARQRCSRVAGKHQLGVPGDLGNYELIESEQKPPLRESAALRQRNPDLVSPKSATTEKIR